MFTVIYLSILLIRLLLISFICHILNAVKKRNINNEKATQQCAYAQPTADNEQTELLLSIRLFEWQPHLLTDVCLQTPFKQQE